MTRLVLTVREKRDRHKGDVGEFPPGFAINLNISRTGMPTDDRSPDNTVRNLELGSHPR